MNILIPAKGRSTRLPFKNLMEIGGKSLLVWAIDKCKKWFPDAVIYVASEHSDIRNISEAKGCKLYDISLDDIEDRRTATNLFDEFINSHQGSSLLISTTSPFTFKKEIFSAIMDGRDFVRSGYIGQIANSNFYSDMSRLTHQMPETTILTGNFVYVRKPLKITTEMCCKNVIPISWISAIDIDYKKDLELCQWLCRFLTIDDFE